MKIDSSKVEMNSNRNYSAVGFQSVEISQGWKVPQKDNDVSEKKGEKDTTNISEQAKEYAKDQKQAVFVPDTGVQYSVAPVSLKDIQTERQTTALKLLTMMLDSLSKVSKKSTKTDIMSSFFQSSSSGISINLSGNGSSDARTPGVWTKTVKVSSFKAEIEHTTFSTAGLVKTADGRLIQFDVDLEMSRGSMEYTNLEWDEEVKCTDPLVINLDSNTASFSDQKFLFDINADGTKENIAVLNKGSGYLALDKNGDGTINDGSELFGAKTGNGFEELRQYDMDGNGWIDENDEVFNQLKVWTKDENGKDKLVGIGDAGIGAIHLGSVSTDFSLKGDDGKLDGQIKRTGVYLKENGEAGTIQHVDVAI